MLAQHFLGALRLIARHRAYTAISIGGLALGLAGCLLMLGYVRYEASYDSWLPGHERVFQVQTTMHPPGQPLIHTQASPYPMGERLAADFPQVAAITSVFVGKTVTERNGQPLFIDATVVDRDFFRVFDLPFAQGSAETALPDLNSIVLTESEAIRQFGTADALGKLFNLGAGEGRRDQKVSGVLRDLPRNTNLRLGIISRRDPNQLPAEMRGWGNLDQQHFVKLRDPADAAAIDAAFPKWKKRVVPSMMIDGKMATMADFFDFRLAPLTALHLGSIQEGAMTPGGDRRALATFAIVALLTLGMAVINFVNLSTAHATRRAREVAIRKVLGATKRQLVTQFMVESLVFAGIAIVLALAITELALPWVAVRMGADLQMAYLGEGGMAWPAAALFVATGLLGGVYPAFYLSRFQPAAVLRAGKSSVETANSSRLRAALVVVQFAIAIGLIASTWVIYAQTRYVESVDPGYRRDGLVQIANAWRFTQGSEYEAAQREMLRVPGVTATARTGLGLASTDKTQALMRAKGASDYVSMGAYGVDADFLRTMDIALVAGRRLGDRFATDNVGGLAADALKKRGLNVVVNRTAATRLGYRDPQAAIGKAVDISLGDLKMVPVTIVGVVEDTRFRTAREAIEPLTYLYDPTRTSIVVVRYTNARPRDVMAALNKVWRKFEPEIPFEARFADDIVREIYAAERARGALFAGFSALAVIIACLGLYSLAAFATQRRTKEIGIRKVLGAKVRDIVRLLAWQFSKPVVAANLFAWPVAWWAMRDWLNGFDARIALGPGPFAFAGLLALAIALATVAGQAIRVARLNPIHALRHE